MFLSHESLAGDNLVGEDNSNNGKYFRNYSIHVLSVLILIFAIKLKRMRVRI
jgi:hypothetical protein